MRAHTWAWLASACLLAACVPDVDHFEYACQKNEDCGKGWVCINKTGASAVRVCADGSTLGACEDGRGFCSGGCCGQGEACVEGECCVPDVEIKCYNGEDIYKFDSCGHRGALVTECVDGCDAFSDQCLHCTPECTFLNGAPKECGLDGCGGVCGECNEHGACTDYVCDCHDNAKCQGVCCAPGQVCAPGGGACMDPGCEPQCAGKACGDDGCGGVCGTCPAGQSCQQGACVGGCEPQCEGQACGGDGCGGSCGVCESGQVCAEGQCLAPAACVDVLPCRIGCGDDQACADDCLAPASGEALGQVEKVVGCVTDKCGGFDGEVVVGCGASICSGDLADCGGGDEGCEPLKACFLGDCPPGDGTCVAACFLMGDAGAIRAIGDLYACAWDACQTLSRSDVNAWRACVESSFASDCAERHARCLDAR